MNSKEAVVQHEGRRDGGLWPAVKKDHHRVRKGCSKVRSPKGEGGLQ